MKIGAKKDGTLTAIHLNVISAVGAYGWGAFVGGPARMLYKCPNVLTEEFTVFTNTAPNSAFRAPGFVEGTFALESAIDDLAAKLNIDPLELRLKNYADEEQTEGVRYSSKGLDKAYQLGAQIFDWSGRGKRRVTIGSRVKGFGMASQIWWGAGGPPAYATIKLSANGTATVLTGTQDLGTGTRTILAQIAAEELGFKLDDVSVFLGDTHVGPYSPISAGSGTIASVGPAVRSAAYDAKNQLLDIASQILEVPVESISIRDGMIHIDGKSDGAKPIKEVLSALGNFMIIGKGARGPNPNEAVNTFGAQFAEVEVDLETGEVSVIRIVAAHESGRVMNLLTVESQIEGGVTQGLGFGLMEERIIDKTTGRLVNANLEDYKVPTVLDIPEIIPLPVDLPDTLANNIGAKGVGEPPIIPTAAAIANAIKDATGTRVRESPITRQRLLNILYGAN
jgi:xanthine dehydrogenase YagR molybdenum-binding subunit